MGLPRKHLASVVALAIVLTTLISGRALADLTATSWTGNGTLAGHGLSWTDPANWDNGVPHYGYDVTIAPTVPTHVTDVPSIWLGALHLTGTGLVPYDLSTSTPQAQVDVGLAFEWRSGTLGFGITI